MQLLLQRKPTENETTYGQLFIDGSVFCFTLEDALRDHKIAGITCIPAGNYRLSLEESHRFGPQTLTLNDVPGFSYIRIHAGNDASNTEGCIIVGDTINKAQATISGGTIRVVLKRLKEKVARGLEDGEVWITIKNPEVT